jgi:hypothetical protein
MAGGSVKWWSHQYAEQYAEQYGNSLKIRTMTAGCKSRGTEIRM